MISPACPASKARPSILASTPFTREMMVTGAPVTIVSRVNGVEVKMDGVALEAGHAGDIIRVKNTSSRKIIRGRIVDEFTVEIVQR